MVWDNGTQFRSAHNQAGFYMDMILLRQNLIHIYREAGYGNTENSQMLLKEFREAGNSCFRGQACFTIQNSDGDLRGKLSQLWF